MPIILQYCAQVLSPLICVSDNFDEIKLLGCNFYFIIYKSHNGGCKMKTF